MSAWRPAPSVRLALDEADRRWPARRRDADGIVGDQAHAGRRSDHNPDSRGVVHAFDITTGPRGGLDGDELRAAIVDRRDERVAYVIWNRRITWAVPHDGVAAWGWQPYSGDPHTGHLHVSIWSDLNISQAGLFGSSRRTFAEGDLRPWWTPASSPAPPLLQEDRRMLTATKGSPPAVLPLLGRAGRVIVACDRRCVVRVFVGRRDGWEVTIERLELEAGARSFNFTAAAQLAVLSVVEAADGATPATIRDTYA